MASNNVSRGDEINARRNQVTVILEQISEPEGLGLTEEVLDAIDTNARAAGTLLNVLEGAYLPRLGRGSPNHQLAVAYIELVETVDTLIKIMQEKLLQVTA